MELTIIFIQSILLLMMAAVTYKLGRTYRQRIDMQTQMNRALRAEYMAVADQLALLTTSNVGDHPGMTCAEAGDLLKFYLGDAAQPKGLEDDDDN